MSEADDGKVRCQSCGMPIAQELGNFGTEADGSAAAEFCMFCYKDGAFTRPSITMEEMIVSSIENMTTDLGMSQEQAARLAYTVIPALERWQKGPGNAPTGERTREG